MGSDGVWDNLFDQDVAECVQREMIEDLLKDPEKAANCISNKALQLGLSKNYKSPFHIGAQQAGLYYPPKGKPDDIVTICA